MIMEILSGDFYGTLQKRYQPRGVSREASADLQFQQHAAHAGCGRAPSMCFLRCLLRRRTFDAAAENWFNRSDDVGALGHRRCPLFGEAIGSFAERVHRRAQHGENECLIDTAEMANEIVECAWADVLAADEA